MTTLKLSEIIPDKHQPRKYFQVEKMASLKDSIKKHGIIQPLVVQRDKNGYLLIDGERRYRAASDLKLKEVPVVIVIAKGDFERMVEQFHIQEQHESWSATEKAMAILEISKTSGKGVREVCEILSIGERQMRTYLAFAELQNKEKFLSYQISLENAEHIKELKLATRAIKEKVLDEPFTRAQEGKMEKILVEKINRGEIGIKRGDYTRLKDSFRSEPKLIDKFLDHGESIDLDEQYIGSKAQGAASLRNAVFSAAHITSYGKMFLKLKNVAMTDSDITYLKAAARTLKEILSLVGE